MKKTLLLVLALLSTGAFAQSTTTTTTTTTTNAVTSTASTSTTLDRLKEGPFSLTLINSFGTDYKKGKNEGFGNAFYITPGYKISENDSINFEQLFQQSITNAGDVSNKYTYATLNYTRSNIIKEEDMGFALKANVRLRAYVNTIANDGDNKGYARVGATVSKKFSDKVSAYVSQQFAQYIGNSSDAGQRTNYLYTYGSANYALTDKVGFGVTGEYIFTSKEGMGEEVYTSGDNAGKIVNANESVILTLDANYQATENLSLALTAGAVISSAHDGGATSLENIGKNTNIGFDAVFSVF